MKERYKSAAIILLKLQTYLHADREMDKWSHDESLEMPPEEELSKYLFPSVIGRIFTGSKAEGLSRKNSDVDCMYEIGPVLIHSTKKERCWYISPSDKPGFYLVRDEADRLIHPKLVQQQVAPCLKSGTGRAELSTADALFSRPQSVTLPNSEHEHRRTRDNVAALRLASWPANVLENFLKRSRNRPILQEKLLGRPTNETTEDVIKEVNCGKYCKKPYAK